MGKRLTALALALCCFLLSACACPKILSIRFPPYEDSHRPVIQLYDNAEKSIHLAIYSLTKDEFADALIRAHKRGVEVKVLMDKGQALDSKADDERLENAGIALRRSKGDGSMHNKFAVIDGIIVYTGSYNHTDRATTKNDENYIIIRFLSLDPLNRLHATVLANLGRFNTLLTDYESSLRLGGRPVNWPCAMKGLCWYINTYASGSYDEQPSEDLRGINAVQIMTVHQAKGLEWPIVFIPSLMDRRFPSSQTGNRQDWFVPRNMFDAERYEGDIEGERRLFYVAVTRAKDLLFLSKFRKIKVGTSESRFIDPVKNLLDQMEDSRQLPIVDITTNSNDEEIQTYTAGEIISFMRCPYFYCFREIWNYQAGLATELGYGKSLHFCLRNISELIKTGYKPHEAVRKSVEENFHLPFAGEGVKENMKRRAQKVLHDFVLKNLQDMSKIEEVETRIEFPLQKATITGRVDVIMRDRNDYEARDYKTSDEMTTEETSAFQVKLYTLGLRSIGRPVTKASVAVLEEGRIKPVDISDRSISEAKALAEKAIESIHRGNFNPSPGQFCPHCDYSKICISCPSG